MSIVRKIALNLLRSAPTRDGKPKSAPMKRIRANARFANLLQVLASGGTKDALEPRRRARRASKHSGEAVQQDEHLVGLSLGDEPDGVSALDSRGRFVAFGTSDTAALLSVGTFA